MNTITFDTYPPDDIKRFYLPGLCLKLTCPRCKTIQHHDYSGDWCLSYPSGDPINIMASCPECHHEWKAYTITLKVQVSVTTPESVMVVETDEEEQF